MKLRELLGCGEKIMLFTLPFVIFGVTLNIIHPSIFSVGGPSSLLQLVSLIILISGVAVWIWSVVLILKKVPKKELITTGPYSVVKHPLYTGVAFLVLPWAGFIFNTWLGVAIGLIMYTVSRIFSPQEEKQLSDLFGVTWDEYCENVKITWL